MMIMMMIMMKIMMMVVNEIPSQSRHLYSILCLIVLVGTICGFFRLFCRGNSYFDVLFLFVFVLKMALI